MALPVPLRLNTMTLMPCAMEESMKSMMPNSALWLPSLSKELGRYTYISIVKERPSKEGLSQPASKPAGGAPTYLGVDRAKRS